MKKICIVNLNVYGLFNNKSDAPMGGAELDMYILANGLKDYYNVSVITGDWGQEKIKIVEGIKIFRSFKLNRDIINLIKAPFVLWKTLIKVNSDIYLSSSAGAEVGIISLYCLLYKKKYIYRTAHEVDCNKTYVNKNGLAGLLYKYGLLNASKIVTSVKKHLNLLSHSYPAIPKNNITNIPLGINLNKSDITTSNKNYILWIARGTKWKRPEIFLEMAKKITTEKFVMIMPEQNTENELFEKIKLQANSIDNLTFIGGVPFNSTQKYFNEAKLFINTSDNEGFTYTLIQSGIAKTPVAYLNVNPDNVITKHNIGEFGNGSVEDLIKDIEKLLNNTNLWKKKSEAIYKYVMANHDMDKLVKKWRQLIDSL